MGIVWNIFNLLCGIFIFAWSFFFFQIRSVVHMIFGILIAYLSVTHKICDSYALQWFPFWENFLFTGCTFIYLSLDLFYVNFDSAFFYGFAQLFVFAIGVMYVIFWPLVRFGNISIDAPVPLITLCGGDGGSSSAAAAAASPQGGGVGSSPQSGGYPPAPMSSGRGPPPAPSTTGGPPPPPV